MATSDERAVRHRRRLLRAASVLTITCMGAAALGQQTSTSRALPHGGAVARQDSWRAALGPMAWSDEQWRQRCRGVRTSYNPSSDLSNAELTIAPGDPRWLDFVYWSLDNKITEHQGEAYGGTGWAGPKGGVLLHFAPGSRWERHALMSFGMYVGHVVGSHRWTDTMFPDFFEKYGGVFGVNVKDRLAEIAPRSIDPWAEFLDYCAQGPYARYLFHHTVTVDPVMHRIRLAAGQGVAFSYTYERYRYELEAVLTDCRVVDFFEMYDRFGPGFAARGNWAQQNKYHDVFSEVGYVGSWWSQPGEAAIERRPPPPVAPEVPPDLPDVQAMRRGKDVYLHECAVCHGVAGDGAGPEAVDFQVMPRDFRQGKYKFRTTEFKELPTLDDVERVIRNGVPGTSMPAWSQFLNDQQVSDVAHYLIVLSPRFVDAYRSHATPRELEIPPPPSDLAALADRGQKISRVLVCFQCHGVEGRGDGETAPALIDDWGHPTPPADLTYKWSFKNGYTPADIYRSIFGGLNGTPMGSYAGAVPDMTDRWALVAYVLSFSPQTRPVLHLKEFAAERDRRIGRGGHVRPEGELP